MKSVPLLVLINFILVIKGDKLIPFRAVKCPSILPFKHKLQVTVLDLDGNSNEDLKTCVMQNYNPEQSTVLINGYYTHNIPKLQKYKTTENPNVIIMTKLIHPDVLLLPAVRRVLSSHRSIVYVAVTNETIYNCKNDTFNDHEFRALQVFMNKLWRIYNIMQAAATFPLSCKHKVAVYSEKTNTRKSLYDRTIKLINRADTKLLYDTIGQSGLVLTEGYPLKANIFPRYPTAINDCDNLHYYTKMDVNLTQGLCGLDALVMYNIVKHFKFKLSYPKNNTCSRYGYAVSNVSTVGSLGCVVRQELDISFNSRFMTMYSKDDIYFAHYVTTDSLCVMIKRPGVIPMWHYPISVYEYKLWFFIFALVVCIGLVMWAVGTFKSTVTGKRKDNLFYYIKDVFTATMFGFSLITNRKLYMLRGTCLCSSVMFVAVFQGHINHMFTAVHRYETIETLDDVYRSSNNLYVSPSIQAILNQLRNPDNELQRNFLEHSRLAPENYTLELVVKNPHAALLGRKQDSLMEILSRYMDEHESPLINIVHECLNTYYLSYIARSGFPFYEELQRYMQRIGEAGLPIIYHKWTCNMLRVPQSLPKVRTEPRSFEKIKLEDQRIPFYMLAVGYVVSLIVFFVELVRGYRERRRARKLQRWAARR